MVRYRTFQLRFETVPLYEDGPKERDARALRAAEAKLDRENAGAVHGLASYREAEERRRRGETVDMLTPGFKDRARLSRRYRDLPSAPPTTPKFYDDDTESDEEEVAP